MAKINKIGRAAHKVNNPARDLLYEYADLQRELDLQIGEVEALEEMEPDILRDELIARVKERLEEGVGRERRLRERVDTMLAGIRLPHHREALTRRYIDGESWPEIVEALGITDKHKACGLHKCALESANKSLDLMLARITPAASVRAKSSREKSSQRSVALTLKEVIGSDALTT